jgi:hypothetical protein
MVSTRSWVLSASLVLALAASSCRKKQPETAADDRSSSSSPTDLADVRKHWVQDERLRGVMAEISRQAGHWPAGVPDDPESPGGADAARAFADAATLADGLARAARDIPRSVADREMTPETRRGFTAEARHLRDQAVQLKDAARGRQVERMQRLLDGISSSCISCHSQYRDFTGELGTRRAAAE